MNLPQLVLVANQEEQFSINFFITTSYNLGKISKIYYY